MEQDAITESGASVDRDVTWWALAALPDKEWSEFNWTWRGLGNLSGYSVVGC